MLRKATAFPEGAHTEGLTHVYDAAAEDSGGLCMWGERTRGPICGLAKSLTHGKKQLNLPVPVWPLPAEPWLL